MRLEVFVREQGFALEDEIDQYDPLAAHFILTHVSEPKTAIGTLRLLPYPLPIPKPDEPPAEPDVASSYRSVAVGVSLPSRPTLSVPHGQSCRIPRRREGSSADTGGGGEDRGGDAAGEGGS